MISMISVIDGGNEIARTEISLTGSITIDARGMASFMVVLPTADDAITEEDETFTVTLSIPIGQITMLDPAATTVTTTIAANDRTPTGTWSISQTAATINEGDDAIYTIQYTGIPAEEEQTVSITGTLGQTGANPAIPDDFDDSVIEGGNEIARTEISLTGSITIDARGMASVMVVLPTVDDAITEEDETFTVTLSIPIGQITMLDPAATTVTTTIAANDRTPTGTWSIRQTAATINEGDDAIYTIQYTGTPAEEEQTVSITGTLGQTGANPAIPDDFDDSVIDGGNEIARTEISLTGSITIDARGMASFMVVLPTADDAITEEDETFTVTLSIPIGQITMLDPAATTVTTTIAANESYTYRNVVHQSDRRNYQRR